MAIRTIPQSHYYSGQGQVIFADRNPLNGRPMNPYKVGNAPALELQINTTQVDHRESMSGSRSVDLTLITEIGATLSLTLESVTLQNLSGALYGDVTSLAGGTVASEILGEQDSSKGGYVVLNHNQISNLVLTYDVSGSPTPVPETAYFLDEDFGTFQWNPEFTPAITGAVTAAYEYAASDRLDALTSSTPPERYVRFEGINTIDDSLVLVEMPRVLFQPLQSLPMITEEIAQVQMTATILPDPFLSTGSRFFRQTYITPSSP